MTIATNERRCDIRRELGTLEMIRQPALSLNKDVSSGDYQFEFFASNCNCRASVISEI